MLALAEEQGKELTEKEMQDLAALDRQFIFIEEMSKVGLNDDEATHLFVAIQREIERYNDNASSVRKTTTRKKKGGKRSNGHKRSNGDKRSNGHKRRTRKRIKKSKDRR
jgi:hypothetical protein